MQKIFKLARIYLLTLMTLLVISGNVIAQPIQAIFFDMDGVLVDTEQLKYQAWQKALNDKLNINFTLQEYIPLVGSSSQEILSKILSAHKKTISTTDFKSLITDKNGIYKLRQRQGVHPIKPAVKFLKDLLSLKNKSKVKVGIASSAARDEIKTNLHEIGVDPKALDAIVSGDDDLKDIKDPSGTNKPKPYIYQKIAAMLKVEPQNCVVFEDTNAGVVAAYSAKMRVYAVPNRFTAKHDFSKSAGVINFRQQPRDSIVNLLKNGQF